jgi:spermidine/putrescine ABC transporter ATP-binding subunit
MPRAIIELDQIRKDYADVCALDGVSLSVRDGEFLTLLGPSGSGKTTLLNVIAGFVDAGSGTVTLEGRDITLRPAHRRGFGMVFQSYALFPHLTVAENVAYPLRMRRMRRAERAEQVRRYLDLVQLGHAARRFPHELSGGQQQRVALARALVFHPRVLLMDEPLGALDRRLRQTLQFEIKRLHSELGMTVIYVTHDQEEALSMSDRVAVMADGEIVQIGAPKVVYERPASEFVATFLGETNLLAVEIGSAASRDGETVLATHRSSGQALAMSLTAPPGRARLSLRPQHIRLEGPDDDAPGFIGVVVSNTFMGDHSRYECQLGDDSVVVHAAVSAASEFDVGSFVKLVPVDAFAVAFPDSNSSSSVDRSRVPEQTTFRGSITGGFTG